MSELTTELTNILLKAQAWDALRKSLSDSAWGKPCSCCTYAYNEIGKKFDCWFNEDVLVLMEETIEDIREGIG